MFFWLPADVRSLIWQKARFLTATERLRNFLPRRVSWVPEGSWYGECPLNINVHLRLSQRKRMTLSRFLLPPANVDLTYEVTADQPHIRVHVAETTAGHVRVGFSPFSIEHRQVKPIGSSTWTTTHDRGEMISGTCFTSLSIMMGPSNPHE